MTSGVAASHGVETKRLIVSMVVTQGRLMSEPALCPDLAMLPNGSRALRQY
jgi:hypothetical protein